MEDLKKSQTVPCCICLKSQMNCHGGNLEDQREGSGPPAGMQEWAPKGAPKFNGLPSVLFALSYLMETINSCLSGARGRGRQRNSWTVT